MPVFNSRVRGLVWMIGSCVMGSAPNAAAATIGLYGSVSVSASYGICAQGSAGYALPGDPVDVVCGSNSFGFVGSSVVSNTGDMALTGIWTRDGSVALYASAFDAGVMVEGATGPNGFLSIVPRASGFSTTTCYTTIVGSPGGCTIHSYFRSTFTALGVNDVTLLDVTFDATINDDGTDPSVTRSIEPIDLNRVFLPLAFGVPFDLTYQLYAGFSVTSFGSGWRSESTIGLVDPPLIAIYDANMNLLPNARLVSPAGVDYGVSAPDPTPVPEPSTLVLIATGGLAWFRRRRAAI
jgi:hypothetical protein